MPTPAPIRGLIFDLDGTLIDTLPGIVEAGNLALEECQLPTRTPMFYRESIGGGLSHLVQQLVPHQVKEDQTLLRAIYTGFEKHYADTWLPGSVLYPGVDAGLTSLAQLHSSIPIAILSNKPHDFTLIMVRSLFPDFSFNPVFGQRAEFPAKPDPTVALDIAHTWQLLPQEIAFIGDSEMDLLNAHNAGMTSIAVGYGYRSREVLKAHNPHHMVSSFEELVTLLSKLF